MQQSVQGTQQTQQNEPTKANGIQSDEPEENASAKPLLSSSDEEESNENSCAKKKLKKKRKQNTLVYSGKTILFELLTIFHVNMKGAEYTYLRSYK